jgi:hypothetical protein
MSATEHDQSPRARADHLAAALVLLGHAPRRAADPEEDCRIQQATLVAVAAKPYLESAAAPHVSGQPPLFAEAVQEVHGRPDDPHRPVHEHLITHLGLAAQYLHALFGPLPGQQHRPETLRALLAFNLALLGTAAATQTQVQDTRMGYSREEDGRRVRSVSYVIDAAELARLAHGVTRAAEEFLTHLDDIAPPEQADPRAS